MTPDVPDTRPSAAAFTLALALFLLLNGFAFNGLLWSATPEPYKETVLTHSWDVVHARSSDDSWGVMKEALDYIAAPGAQPLYSELFFKRKLRFQYPPSSLFALSGMIKVAGPAHVRTNEFQTFAYPTMNDIVGLAFLLMTAAAAAALLEIGLRRHEIDGDSAVAMAARIVIVGGFTITFYPIVKAYTLGQIQTWINGLFALALLAWVMGARASSGVLIGLMCLIKPHYGLFVLWAALRREWRFAAACVATVAVGLSAAIAVYGWANHVDYLRVLTFLSQHGETFFPNQSVNGLLNRLMSIADPVAYKNLLFIDGEFTPYTPWIYATTLVTSVIILAAALLRTGNTDDPDRTLDFCTMGLSATIASPVAWEHHFGVMLPIFAVLVAATLGNRTRLLIVAAAYVLISNFIPATNLLATTAWNVAQSYLFAAALAVLLLLHCSRPGWQVIGFPTPKLAH